MRKLIQTAKLLLKLYLLVPFAAAQKPSYRIVKNPVELGQHMTVTCSVGAIGGVESLYRISDEKAVLYIRMYRTGARHAGEMFLAQYDINQHSGKITKTYGSDLPPEITKNSFAMDGIGIVDNDRNDMTNNAFTVSLSMSMAARLSHMETYTCSFYYITKLSNIKEIKNFTQKARPLAIVSNPVELGQTMTVNCSVDAVGGVDGFGGDLDDDVTVLQISRNSTNPEILATYNCTAPEAHRFEVIWPGLQNPARSEEGCMDGSGRMARDAYLSLSFTAKQSDLQIYMCRIDYKNTHRVFRQRTQGTIKMITPKLAEIGRPLTVTCSLESIGGILPEIGPDRKVYIIWFARHVAGSGKRRGVARYTYRRLQKSIVDDNDKNMPHGVTGDSFSMDNMNSTRNADSVYLKMSVSNATCDLVTPFTCKFEYYYRRGKLHQLHFTDDVVVKTKVSPVTMTSTPDLLKYAHDQNVRFTCTVNGPAGMSLKWEIKKCDEGSSFTGIQQTDAIAAAVRNIDTPNCDDPPKAYTSSYTVNLSREFCAIQCAAYGRDDTEINKYFRYLNGTPSPLSPSPRNVDRGHKPEKPTSTEKTSEINKNTEFRLSDTAIGLLVSSVIVLIGIISAAVFYMYVERKKRLVNNVAGGLADT